MRSPRRRRTRARVLATGALLAAATLVGLVMYAGADDQPVSVPRSAAPFVEGTEERADNAGALTVRDLRMGARDGGQISGYIVRPRRLTQPAAAVILMHGLNTDASDLVIEGALLAKRGAIAIVPDNAFVRLGPADEPGLDGMRQDRRRRLASAQDVADLVAALEKNPRVDPRRIAVAGYSMGGYILSLIAGDLPLAAEVYVSTGGGWIKDPSLTRNDDARAIAAELDPVAAIEQASDERSRPRLVQFGKQDDRIGVDRLRRFAAAAPEPKRVAPYDAGHLLNVKAVSHRVDWLGRELHLRPR